MSLAFVFPGQGSQSVGMLAELADADPAVKETFAEASSVLGYDLWSLCQQGPEEELAVTEKTQPAMLAAGVAAWRVWKGQGGAQPVAMAGHSLGEYTALVCANAIDFPAAVDLVRTRGRLMQEAVPLGQGAMAAILGLDDEAVEVACKVAADGEVVEAVNFNAPGQVVVAGNTSAVNRAIEQAKQRGAKRATLLPVSVPSHSSLMFGAAEKLAERLRDVEIRMPDVPEVFTVDLRTHESPDGIRMALKEQLHKPVRWADTVRTMFGSGVRTVVECGPGKVLTSLNRRIQKGSELATFPIDSPASLAKALAACRERKNA